MLVNDLVRNVTTEKYLRSKYAGSKQSVWPVLYNQYPVLCNRLSEKLKNLALKCDYISQSV